MKKLTTILVTFILVCTTALTGCGKSATPTTTPAPADNTKSTDKPADAKSDAKADAPAPTGKETNLTAWTFVGLHAQLYKDAAVSWNKDHPDQPIAIKVTTYPYADMHNKLLIALKSGVGAPDISDIERGQFPNFLQGNIQLADLSDVVAPDKDKFVQSRLDIYSKDGKLYGMPTHVGATVAFYNKDLFEKAGVDPTTIKTWDDYRAAGKQIKEKTGKYMNYIAQTAAWDFSLMIGELGSDYFDAQGNVTLDSPTNIKVLQMLHDMIYVDKISTVGPGGQVDTDAAYGAVDKGEVASVVMPFWYTSRFLANMPDLKGKMIVAAPPVFANDNKFTSVGLGGTGTVVTMQSKNIDLAKNFLFYAKGTQQANLNIWNKLGFDPPRWDVWDQISQNMGDNPFTQYFANGKDMFNILIPLKDSIYSPVSSPLGPSADDLLNTKVLFNVLKNNSQTPDVALKAAADELRKKATSTK